MAQSLGLLPNSWDFWPNHWEFCPIAGTFGPITGTSAQSLGLLYCKCQRTGGTTSLVRTICSEVPHLLAFKALDGVSFTTELPPGTTHNPGSFPHTRSIPPQSPTPESSRGYLPRSVLEMTPESVKTQAFSMLSSLPRGRRDTRSQRGLTNRFRICTPPARKPSSGLPKLPASAKATMLRQPVRNASLMRDLS